MIRVIYTWDVAPENVDRFETVWRETTRAIHDTTEGALGSFCLRSIDNPRHVLTIALWETEAQWRAFIAHAKVGPMSALHALGEQLSAVAFQQLGDETVALS